MASAPLKGCPACGSAAPLQKIEDHFDRIGQKPYRVLLCRACGVASSEPREAVGAEWYEKCAPIRAQEARPPAEADWRYQQFLAAKLPPGKLLDVGCGDGSFLSLAQKNGF